MLTLHVEIDGLVHKLETTAELATQLDEPLARFGKYWLKRTHKVYESGNFAPLAESTIEKRAQRGLRSMEGKLRRDVGKAEKRARGPEKRGLIAALLGTTSLSTSAVMTTRGVQNRMAVLAEFHRRHGVRGSLEMKKSRLADVAGTKEMSLKQRQALSLRTVRAVASAVNKPILFGLGRTLQVEHDAGSVTLRSRTHEQWSQAHNEGETVGHGATLPERRGVEAKPADLEVLISILKEHVLMPFTPGAHGPGF